MNGSLPQLLASAARRRGPAPFVTFYDGAGTERTELSYATFDNWASKTANWLVEEHGVDSRQTVTVSSDDHWRALVVTAACWKVGAIPQVAAGGLSAGDEVLAYADDYDDPDVADDDVVVVAARGPRTAAEVIGVCHDLLPAGARVLSTHRAADEDFAGAVVAVLCAAGSLVWAPGADADAVARRAQQERATHVWTPGDPAPRPLTP